MFYCILPNNKYEKRLICRIIPIFAPLFCFFTPMMQYVKDLTHGSIRGQLVRLALPVMGSSFVQMAYSFTDMAWVGSLGSKSVAAIGAVGVLTWTSNSLALINKVGAEVNVSQCIGAQRMDKAQAYASHNLTLALLISVVWTTLIWTCAVPLIGIFGMESDVTQLSVEYLRVVSTAFPFIFMSAAFTGIYNASGHTQVPFYVNGIGLALNMLLDPLFILGFGMGTLGAAWATWISQATVCLMFFYVLMRRRRLFERFRILVPLRLPYVPLIFKVGLPVALLNIFFSLISLFMGRTASAEGGYLGVMTLTAGGQLEAIAWYTSQGFSTALSTFVAQNYAAGCTERIRKAFKMTLGITAAIGAGCRALFYGGGEWIFSLITSEPDAYRAGGLFLKIDSYSMIFMMLEITTQGVFYGTGRTMPPALVSIAGNVLRIPLALLLGHWGWGIAGVWWAVSMSSILKGCVLFGWLVLRRHVLLTGSTLRPRSGLLS